jgi:hypothetical protein
VSPVRLISIDDEKKELRSYGCTPLSGKGKLNTAEWWCWPWGGAPFTLPVDENGKIDQWAFHRLLADMAKLAPTEWEFPLR